MNNSERIYVDFHVLQTVPPSCVNRDDTGSPKTAIYGGVTRARVSSQAWKRAMRLKFQDILSQEDVGQRTKMVIDLIAGQVIALDPECTEKQAQDSAKKVLEAAGVKVKEDKNQLKTGALFFISPSQIHQLAEIAARQEKAPNKTECKEALKARPSVDLALFGRMVADDPGLNFDAAAQVAHAISTHAIENEFDYFTAVDDCAPEDNAGAGHLGTVEFNSSTLYRIPLCHGKCGRFKKDAWRGNTGGSAGFCGGVYPQHAHRQAEHLCQLDPPGCGVCGRPPRSTYQYGRCF